jgi:hypothetical protein
MPTELISNVQIPEGQCGAWRVEKFEVTAQEADVHNLRAVFNARRGETRIDPGVYTRLMHGGAIVMSDTPGEKQDHYRFVQSATGNVLIAGLGLGMVTSAVLAKDDVKHVTVVEIAQDVVELVTPHLASDKLEVITADIFKWKPAKGAQWDCAWFDIWPCVSEQNLVEIKKLRAKFVRRCKQLGFWKLYTIRGLARESARERRLLGE